MTEPMSNFGAAIRGLIKDRGWSMYARGGEVTNNPMGDTRNSVTFCRREL